MDINLRQVLLVSLIGFIRAECPNGWTVFDGSCYLFPQQEANFLDANRHCTLLQSHLVNVGTQRENTFIKSFAAAEKDHYHWIGLNDIALDGVWNWVDTGNPTTITDWAPGQPDGGTTQNCVILLPANGFAWHDQHCNVLQHFICEKPLNSNVDEVIG